MAWKNLMTNFGVFKICSRFRIIEKTQKHFLETLNELKHLLLNFDNFLVKPEICPPISTGGQHSVGCIESMNASILQIHGHHSHASIAVHYEIQCEIFNKILAIILQ
jgi:hypothetical protein